MSLPALNPGRDRFRRIYEDAAVALFELDLDGHLSAANAAMFRLFGYSTERALLEADKRGALFASREDRVLWLEKLRSEGTLVNYKKSMRTRDGRLLELVETTALVRDERGKPLGYQGSAMDVGAVFRLSGQLTYDDAHDTLTGLANRGGLERVLKDWLDAMTGGHESHALCYFDLDQFKLVNDTFGHAAGDELLRQLAADLAARVGDNNVLARLGGDEFALLLRNRDARQAGAIANNLLKRIRAFRLPWGAREVDITASIGVVTIDDASLSVGEILGAADAACYTAKEKGRNRVQFQGGADQTVSRRLTEMRSVIELKHALQENRLVLYKQAIYPLQTHADGELRFELLVRMIDSSGDLLQPGQFLPAAEKYNLAPDVDRWVIEAFCDWFRNTEGVQDRLVYGAINLSGHTLGSEESLGFVCDTLDKYGVPGPNVCFEITETAAINNFGAAQRFIQELKARGCRFALDDFGSGVSSFGYLKHLPVDYIKIDGMFVRMLKNSDTDRVIVRSINEVAHSLGLLSIAEFVEDKETLDIVAELGVDYAQGHAIGYPEPLE